MRLKIIAQKLLEKVDTKIVLKDLGGIWEEFTNTLKINTFESKISDSTWADESGEIIIKDIHGTEIFKLIRGEGENDSWLNKNKVTTIIDIEFPSTVKATLVPEYTSSDIEYLESHGKSIIGNLKDLDIYTSGEGKSAVYKSDWYRYIKISRDTPLEYSYPYVNNRGEIITQDNFYTEYTDLITFFSDGSTILLNASSGNTPIVPIHGVATKTVYRILDSGEREEIKKEIISLRDVPGIKFCIMGQSIDYNYDDLDQLGGYTHGKFEDSTFTLYLNSWEEGTNSLFVYFTIGNGVVSNTLRISSTGEAVGDSWFPVYISGVGNSLIFSPGITNNVVLRNDARFGEPNHAPQNIKIVTSSAKLDNYFTITAYEETRDKTYQVKFNITLSSEVEIDTIERIDLSIQDSETGINLWSTSAIIVSGSTSEYSIYDNTNGKIDKIRLDSDRETDFSTLGSSTINAKFIRTFEDYEYEQDRVPVLGTEAGIFGRIDSYLSVEVAQEWISEAVSLESDQICYNKIDLNKNSDGAKYILMVTKGDAKYEIVPNRTYGIISSISGSDNISYIDGELVINGTSDGYGWEEETLTVTYENDAIETINIILNGYAVWNHLYLSSRPYIPDEFSKEKTIGYFVFSTKEISEENLIKSGAAVSIYPVTVLPNLRASLIQNGRNDFEMVQVKSYIQNLRTDNPRLLNIPIFIGTGKVNNLNIQIQNTVGWIRYNVPFQNLIEDDFSLSVREGVYYSRNSVSIGAVSSQLNIEISLSIYELPSEGYKIVEIPVTIDDITLKFNIALAKAPNFIGFYNGGLSELEDALRDEIINIFEEEIDGWGSDEYGIATGDIESNDSITKTLRLVSLQPLGTITQTQLKEVTGGVVWDTEQTESVRLEGAGAASSTYLPQGYYLYNLTSEFTRLNDLFPQYPACKLSTTTSETSLFVFYMPKNPYKIAKIPKTVWITRDDEADCYSSDTVNILNNYFTFESQRNYSTVNYTDPTPGDEWWHPCLASYNQDGETPYVRYISHSGRPGMNEGDFDEPGYRGTATWDYNREDFSRDYLDGVFFYKPHDVDEKLEVTCNNDVITVSASSKKFYDLYSASPSDYNNYVAEVYIISQPIEDNKLPHANHFPESDILENLGITAVAPEFEYDSNIQLSETYQFTNGYDYLYPGSEVISDGQNSNLGLYSESVIVLSRIVIRSRETYEYDILTFAAEGQTRQIPGGPSETQSWNDCDGFFEYRKRGRSFRPGPVMPTMSHYVISKNRYTYIQDQDLLSGMTLSDFQDLTLATTIENWVSEKRGTWIGSSPEGSRTLLAEGITKFMMLGDKFYGLDYIIKTKNNIITKTLEFSSEGERKDIAFSFETAERMQNYDQDNPGASLSDFLSNNTNTGKYISFNIENSEGEELFEHCWLGDLDNFIEDQIEIFYAGKKRMDLMYTRGQFGFVFPENSGMDLDFKVNIYYNDIPTYGGRKIAEIILHQNKKSAVVEGSASGTFSAAGYGAVKFTPSEWVEGGLIESNFYFIGLDYEVYNSAENIVNAKLHEVSDNHSYEVREDVVFAIYEPTEESITIPIKQDWCCPRYSKTGAEGSFESQSEQSLSTLDSKLYYKLFRSFNGNDNEVSAIDIDGIDIKNITYTLTDRDGEHEYNTKDIFNSLSTEIVLESSDPDETIPYIKTISKIKEN